ncbi:MAG: DinB family protein [Blastocatellia bacterium]|nr:DinB family protein [Blastocatellia bacterium]
MKHVLKRLDRVHEKLAATVAPLDEVLFARQPADGGWSVAQIIQHLALVEDRVIKDLEKEMSRPPRKISFIRRFVPTSIVSSRLLRVKAPQAVNPEANAGPAEVNVLPSKASAIANYNRARNDLKNLCATHGNDRFRQIVFKHPFLGEIDGVATVSFVGYHEQRHYKQIREVLKKIARN